MRYEHFMVIAASLLVLFTGCIGGGTDEESTTLTEKEYNEDVDKYEIEETEFDNEKGLVSLSNAYWLLTEKTGVNDLKLRSYSSRKVDGSGKSNEYMISGLSTSRERVYYIIAEGATFKLVTVKKPTDTLSGIDSISSIMDSAQIISTPLRDNRGCAGDIRLEVSGPLKRATVMCEGEWTEKNIDIAKF